ncbi:MAG: GNAT family N-acetyltransferase [Acidobacteria bacterium]|nr:GNAT family N-acetyltransferase [Acidobacteriota bacterium]
MAVAPRLSPFEVLDLRMLPASALAELFEEERRHWETELRWDYGSSVELLRRHIDAHSLPGYAALWQGRVAGYCFFVYEEEKGLLGDLYVLAAHRGGVAGEPRPVATALLEHALETLEQSPVVKRIEAQLIPFGLEPLEPLFGARGYRIFPRLFMLKELQRGAPALATEPLAAAPVRPWEERDFDAAADLIVSAYQEHIDSQINDHYSHSSGALRFLKNIILFPGCGIFRAGWSFVAEGSRGRLDGAVLVSEVAHGIAHVTQICVRPELQKHGLGRRLMQATLAAAVASGCTGVSLTVTAENRSAVNLYRGLGFTILKEFSAFTHAIR